MNYDTSIEKLVRLDCPSCGAPLDITSEHLDSDIIQCKYCGSKYNIHGQGVNKTDYIEEDKSDEEDEDNKTYSSSSTSWNSPIDISSVIYLLCLSLLIAILFPIVFDFTMTNNPTNITTSTNMSNSTITIVTNQLVNAFNAPTTTFVSLLNNWFPFVGIFIVIVIALILLRRVL